MECEENKNDPISREFIDQYDTLQKIVQELRLSNYQNEAGPMVCNVAFIKLEELAKTEQGVATPIKSTGEIELAEQASADEPFHIEGDIYDSGDYANLLVIPCNGNYLVVANNEHLATLAKTCDEPECWEQLDGNLEDEAIEKLGIEISAYIDSI